MRNHVEQVRASVITPAYPGRWKKGQNSGNPCAYSEKPTSHRKFLGFLIFYRDFLYFPMFCYIVLGFPINGHPQILRKCFLVIRLVDSIFMARVVELRSLGRRSFS